MNPTAHIPRELEAKNVKTFATRNLEVLRAIDKTLDGLDENATLLEGMVRDVEAFQARLCAGNIAERVDPDGAIAGTLDAAVNIVGHVYGALRDGRADVAACMDFTDEDGVVDGFDVCLRLVERLHDALTGLREWIVTHDALLDEPAPGSFDSADDLFKAIGIHL